VDTGAFLLAAAHLVGSIRTSVYWESAGALRALFPELILSDRPYEIEERRFLCAGGVAVLDMMIALLEPTHGPALAAGVAGRLMHDRGGNTPTSSLRTSATDPG
jgi:transcriptional regulator GlxA family with amidase domain